MLFNRPWCCDLGHNRKMRLAGVVAWAAYVINVSAMKTVTIFGLGEAGSLIAADLAAAGVKVRGYDPAEVKTPAGVERVESAETAVSGSGVVLGITASFDALGALRQALDALENGTLYADLSTGSAGLKLELASLAASRGVDFADVALMSTVPGKGLKVPALTSGPGADRFVSHLAPLGMPVSTVGSKAGDAATRKLLRSVMMKGLAGVVVEAMRAGEKAGCADWLWRNLADQITAADDALLSRLVKGTGTHSLRRRHEMEAAQALLEELGVDPVMTRATVENLRRIPEDGMPVIPE